MASEPTRFSTVTPDDHGSSIWITVLICWSFASIALGVRCWSRKARSVFGFSSDDYAIFVAYLVAVVRDALLMVALVNGLGKNANIVSESQQGRMAKFFYASQTLLFCALYTTKYSVILLVQRLFTKEFTKEFTKGMRIFWTLPIVVAVVGIVSVIVISVPCWPKQMLQGEGGAHCSQYSLRWILVTVADVVTEVMIVTLPTYLTWKTQMALKRKLKTIGPFVVSRVLVIVISISFVYSRVNIGRDGNPGTAIVLPVVLHQSELALALITAMMIPCITLFGVVAESHAVPGPASRMPSTIGKVEVTTSISMRSVRKGSHDVSSSDTVGMDAESINASLQSEKSKKRLLVPFQDRKHPRLRNNLLSD